LLASVAALAGCTSTDTYTSPSRFQRPPGTVRVLLMPPEVQIYEKLASGLEEPRADWTATGQRNVAAALAAALRGRNAEPVTYTPPQGDPVIERRHVQLIKLHNAVGASALAFQSQLAAKKGRFDWTLGSEANLLNSQFGTDYALFLYLRDSYSSAGRGLLKAFVAIISFGSVWIAGGAQGAVASLVDLKTGNIVWFSTLASSGGDVLSAEPARDFVDDLLEEFPL
jgi:hypothetical protein